MAVYNYGFGIDLYARALTERDIYAGFCRYAGAKLRKAYHEYWSKNEGLPEEVIFSGFLENECSDVSPKDAAAAMVAILISDELAKGGYANSCLFQEDYVFIPVSLPVDGEKPLTENVAMEIFSKYIPDGFAIQYWFINDGS